MPGLRRTPATRRMPGLPRTSRDPANARFAQDDSRDPHSSRFAQANPDSRDPHDARFAQANPDARDPANARFAQDDSRDPHSSRFAQSNPDARDPANARFAQDDSRDPHSTPLRPIKPGCSRPGERQVRPGRLSRPAQLAICSSHRLPRTMTVCLKRAAARIHRRSSKAKFRGSLMRTVKEALGSV